MEHQFAYKIITVEEWKTLCENECFNGTELDKRDGFIHMTANLIQTEQVRNKYYKNKPIILLKLNFQNILQNVKMEEAKNGDVYPHLYGQMIRHENIDEFHTISANDDVIAFFQKKQIE